MTDIDIFHVIDESRLRADKYFYSLVDEAVRCGLVDEYNVQHIQTQLMELLGEICIQTAKKGTSSMRTEYVEEISESVMYTVSVRLKQCKNAEDAVDLLKSEKIEKLFHEGREEISKLLTKARGKWAAMTKELFETRNSYYNDTVMNEIKNFLSEYDYKLAAHKNVLDFGYPVFLENNMLSGAEHLYDYITALFFENKFCSLFDKNRIHELMSGLEKYSSGFDYTSLPVNIYQYVLASALGCEFLGKSPALLCLTQNDVQKITEMTAKKDSAQMRLMFGKAADTIIGEIHDEQLGFYIKRSVEKLLSEINAVPDSYIKTLFIV